MKKRPRSKEEDQDHSHTIGEDEVGSKLMTVCKKHFSGISKQNLRLCFKNDKVYVNSNPCSEETLRMNKGDTIQITAKGVASCLDQRRCNDHDVRIHYQSDVLAIVEKDPGESTTPVRYSTRLAPLLTYVFTHTHTHTRKHIHTYIHTYIHSLNHSFTHSLTHTYAATMRRD